MELLRLKEILQESGVSGKDLAKEVNVSAVSISKIVQNKTFPKPELLYKISEALDMDIPELFIKTRGGAGLNGFVEYRGDIHRIRNVYDLKQLVAEVERNF